MKTESKKQLANHREFYNATLRVKCEEKSGSIYWYGYDDSNLKTVTTRTTRGCGRLSKTVGNPWKRISKKVAEEILTKYGITAEQFIAYCNEDPELMSELEAQRAEEERAELLDFFMSKPLTSSDALQVATEAEIQLAKLAEEKAETADNTAAENVETTGNTIVETKSLQHGAITYYVDGKRVSREIALNAAKENRKGNLFTFETGCWNENTKTVNYKTLMIIAECTIKIQKKAFLHDLGFSVIVSGVEVKTFYASKDITYDIKQARQNAVVLANKIARAYICGAFGVRIMGGCDIKILNAPITEPDIDDYAVSTYAQDAAIAAEIEQAPAGVQESTNVETKGNLPDLTEYKVKISMFGNKTPMFSITVNGKPMNGNFRNWSKKAVDAWVLKAYEEREQYPNMTIEVPRAVAALHLNSFACNPRIVREMNVLLTGMSEYERAQIAEYEKSFNEEGIQPARPVWPDFEDTVSSVAEALALVAKHFPGRLEYDSCGYDYRDGQYYCYRNDPAKVYVIVDGSFPCKFIIIRSFDGVFATRVRIASPQVKATESVAETTSPKSAEPELKQVAVVPCGAHTVASGTEAFALIAPYFPNGIKYDGVDYGYRGETHFIFYDEPTKMSVIVASDEEQRRIEYIDIMSAGNKRLMTVIISKTLAKVTENVSTKFNQPPAQGQVVGESTSDKKKVASKKKIKPKNNSQAERWLEGAKVDGEGRYYVVPELSYKNFTENTNWNPCFYVVTASLKLRRVGLKFAIELAKAGCAIEISKDVVPTLAK